MLAAAVVVLSHQEPLEPVVLAEVVLVVQTQDWELRELPIQVAVAVVEVKQVQLLKLAAMAAPASLSFLYPPSIILAR